MSCHQLWVLTGDSARLIAKVASIFYTSIERQTISFDTSSFITTSHFSLLRPSVSNRYHQIQYQHCWEPDLTTRLDLEADFEVAQRYWVVDLIQAQESAKISRYVSYHSINVYVCDSDIPDPPPLLLSQSAPISNASYRSPRARGEYWRLTTPSTLYLQQYWNFRSHFAPTSNMLPQPPWPFHNIHQLTSS